MKHTPPPGLSALALLAAPALLLVACSGGADETASSSAAPSSSAAASSSAAPSPSEASPSGAPESIFASLCDKATPEQVSLIESVMKPDYTVTQLVDVRTDDDGKHAVLGFVEGPGLLVLAQWTGQGLALEGLAAANEDAVTSSTAPPLGTPDEETQQLLDATGECYTLLFAEGS